MKFFSTSGPIQLPRVITLWLSAVALWLVALTTTALAETQACQHNNQLEAVQYVLALKKNADSILRENQIPLQNLKAYVLSNIEFDSMAKFALGKYWNKATPDQRVRYRRLFEKTVFHTLARHVLQYRDAKLNIDRQYALSTNDVLVTSRLISQAGRTMRIGWRIGFKDCRPIAVDLLIDGASLITTQRQEFNAVVSRHGIDGLLSLLKARAKKQDASANASGSSDKSGREILNRLFFEAAEKLKRQGGLNML